jgi:CheY-specific phosphatase CheX
MVGFSKRNAFFKPAHGKESVRALLLVKEANQQDYQVQLLGPYEETTGDFIVRVMTLQYSFPVELKRLEKDRFSFKPPFSLRVHDLRKCPRLPVFEDHMRLVLTPLSKKGKAQGPGTITLLDLSATGMAGRYEGPVLLSPGDLVEVKGDLFERSVTVVAEVISGTEGSGSCHIRLKFKRILKEVQFWLLGEIYDQLDWQIEMHYAELKRAYQAGAQLVAQSVGKEKKRQVRQDFLAVINPILTATLNVFEAFVGIKPVKKDVQFLTITHGVYDISAELTITGEDFTGTLFFCLKESSLRGLIRHFFEDIDPFSPEAKDMIGEIVNMIVGNAKADLPADRHYHLGIPAIIQGREHVVAVLSNYQVIHMRFDASFGPFDINLFLDDLPQEGSDPEEPLMKFVYDETLLDPFLTATETFFNEYLDFKARKKTVQMTRELRPKFGTSVVINIFSKPYLGKLMLNLSDRLALALYEALLGEPANEIDEGVKDALSEVLNMISGNAKAHFRQHQWKYRLSIPYTILGVQQVLTACGARPFISSFYLTQKGFFQLSLSLVEKQGNRKLPSSNDSC